MAIIGEQFEDLGEYICGAVVNVRQKGDKASQIVLVIEMLFTLSEFYLV